MPTIRLGDNAFVAQQETFLPVDTDSQEKPLQKQGETNGRANSPGAQALQMDAVEQGIVRKIAQTAQRTQSELNNYFVGFAARLLPIVKTWDSTALIGAIKTIPGSVKTGLKNKLHSFMTESAIKGPAWQQAKESYKKFRQDHGLNREPDYLSLKEIFLWFFLLIVVEATLNATLLWELTGILAAFGQTALITAVNVLFGAALVGLCFRYKNYDSLISRWPTLFCIPVVLAILTFNFGVGHYRDALVEAKAQGEQLTTNLDWDAVDEVGSLDFVDYTKKAMESMKASPFKIDSVLSGLLIIVGIGFFGFATHKWYSMFDPYPGYRKRTLSLEEKHMAYKKLVATARNEMERTVKKAEDQIADERTKVMNMRTEHNNLTVRAKALRQDYANWVLVLEKTQNFLLATYRDSNQKVRTEPAPNHFNDKLPIDQQFTKAPETDLPELQDVPQVVEAMKVSGDETQGIANDIWQRFDPLADMQH